MNVLRHAAIFYVRREDLPGRIFRRYADVSLPGHISLAIFSAFDQPAWNKYDDADPRT